MNNHDKQLSSIEKEIQQINIRLDAIESKMLSTIVNIEEELTSLREIFQPGFKQNDWIIKNNLFKA